MKLSETFFFQEKIYPHFLLGSSPNYSVFMTSFPTSDVLRGPKASQYPLSDSYWTLINWWTKHAFVDNIFFHLDKVFILVLSLVTQTAICLILNKSLNINVFWHNIFIPLFVTSPFLMNWSSLFFRYFKTRIEPI